MIAFPLPLWIFILAATGGLLLVVGLAVLGFELQTKTQVPRGTKHMLSWWAAAAGAVMVYGALALSYFPT